MTTDGRQRRGLRWGQIAGAFALVVFGWLAVVVALTFGSAPGKSMAIIGPPSQALAAIARSVVIASEAKQSIVGLSKIWIASSLCSSQ